MNASENSEAAALPYQEPNIKTILVQSSFLLLLNALNHVIDKLLYCGLIGQIMLGIAYGSPSLNAPLSIEAQQVIVQLGYLGLILLVFEGGLNTKFASLKANLLLSTCIAVTGIAAPIGFSFVLVALADASTLQAFTAGAALCSTSLGTVFAIMGATGLLRTRMGVVLSTAAIMDDVVGLVMVQVVANMGGPDPSPNTLAIVRPIFVSLAFLVVVPLVARFSYAPLIAAWDRSRKAKSYGWSRRLADSPLSYLAAQTLVLVGFVVGSTYAGTSNLFAAYIAGASISWWDGHTLHYRCNEPSSMADNPGGSSLDTTHEIRSSLNIFEAYYGTVLDRILKPFFFASIGFSIPISRMFSGFIIWRGVIYTTLMIFSKALCGIWLIRTSPYASYPAATRPGSQTVTVFSKLKVGTHIKHNLPLWMNRSIATKSTRTSPPFPLHESVQMRTVTSRALDPKPQVTQASRSDNFPSSGSTERQASVQRLSRKPLSLYPAAIVSGAMVSRGEIGFLISSVANTKGVLTSASGTDDIFLIITWAIMLCTMIGPVIVGVLVRRVRKLENTRRNENNLDRIAEEVLGVWGMI